jgi:hypothetical protein
MDLVEIHFMGRDSSVGIATRYGMDSLGIESAPVQTDSGTHSASMLWELGLIPGGKAARAWR